jgi:hypothetical protein
LLAYDAFKGTKWLFACLQQPGKAIGNKELKIKNEPLKRENPPDNTYYTD